MSTRMSMPANTDIEMDTDLTTSDISLAKKEPQVKKKYNHIRFLTRKGRRKLIRISCNLSTKKKEIYCNSDCDLLQISVVLIRKQKEGRKQIVEEITIP